MCPACRDPTGACRSAERSGDAHADAADEPEGADANDPGVGGDVGSALDVLAPQQHEAADFDADVGGHDELYAAEQGDLDDVQLRAGELGFGEVELHAADQ